jgi:hypothetical protein
MKREVPPIKVPNRGARHCKYIQSFGILFANDYLATHVKPLKRVGKYDRFQTMESCCATSQ